MRRRTAARALAWLFAATLGWGAVQAAGAINTPEAQRRLGAALSLPSFLAGHTTQALNHVMAHDLPAGGALRAAGGAFRWAVFGSGGPQVRVGCDGWLFLAEELRHWPDAARNARVRLEGVARLVRRLEAEGIAVVVALTPDKARVHRDALCGAAYAAESEHRHDAAMRALAGAVPRLAAWLPALEAARAGGPVFLRTDTHWNGRGAAIAARAVAEAASGVALRRERGIRTTEGPETGFAGDLLRLMGLDRAPDPLRPRPDRVRPRTTTLPEAGGGLLDEPEAPEVVLLGSSFSLNGNFHGALQEALGARVLNMGRAGGGVLGAAREWLQDPAAREAKPRLLVWEVLERGLPQPLSEAERDFLAGLQGCDTLSCQGHQ